MVKHSYVVSIFYLIQQFTGEMVKLGMNRDLLMFAQGDLWRRSMCHDDIVV